MRCFLIAALTIAVHACPATLTQICTELLNCPTYCECIPAQQDYIQNLSQHWTQKVSYDDFEKLLLTLESEAHSQEPPQTIEQALFDSGYWVELCFELDQDITSGRGNLLAYFA
jgi:hypothetical protein